MSLAEADAALRAEIESRRWVPPFTAPTSPQQRIEAEERARLLRHDLTRDAHRDAYDGREPAGSVAR